MNVVVGIVMYGAYHYMNSMMDSSLNILYGACEGLEINNISTLTFRQLLFICADNLLRAVTVVKRCQKSF